MQKAEVKLTIKIFAPLVGITLLAIKAAGEGTPYGLGWLGLVGFAAIVTFSVFFGYRNEQGKHRYKGDGQALNGAARFLHNAPSSPSVEKSIDRPPYTR